MVFRRRVRRRINYRGRRRRLPNVKQMSFFTPRNMYSAARYAVKGFNMLKGIINSELHRYDTNAAIAPNSVPSITLLTAIDQGDDVSNRNGNSILSKYCKFLYDLIINSAGTSTLVRIIVFVDGDNDQQTPTASELLQNTTYLTAPINVDYTSRFTILFDRLHTLSKNGTSVLSHKLYKKLNFHTKYITATGSTGFGRNNIWLFTWSNEATGVAAPSLEYSFRLAYYDN